VSIYKTKSGSWSVRYRDVSGKQHQKTFELKKDAEDYEREQRRSISRGTWTNPSGGKIKLREVFHDYFATKNELTPKSKEAIQSLWKHHVEPAFGNAPIASITMQQITKWATNAAVGDNAYTTSGRITKAQVQLCSILDFAVDHGLIAKNPSRKSNGKINKISMPKTDRTRPTIALTPSELKSLAEACGQYQTLVLLSGITGLRWAEVVGLQVQDVDVEAKYIQVTRSLSEVNGYFHEGGTKTGQTRVVFLPNMLRSRIQVLLIGKNPNDLLFANSTGNPISLSNFTKRIFQPAIESSGVPRITPHDLRHTAASNAIAFGANVLNVANMLGHSDPSITLKRYAHLFTKDQEALAFELNKQFVSI
jgi:integrase